MSNSKWSNVRIGSVRLENPVFLAPMEAVNCTAFRLMCKRYGAGLVYSPMIDVERFCAELEEKDIIEHSHFVDFIEEERPLAIQIGGAKPDNYAVATRSLEQYADIVDINLGCPLSDMLGKKGGAWLAKHTNMMEKVVNAVLENTSKPVTAKIRIGWDDSSINAVEVAKILENIGVAAIAVHGRTCKQHYTKKANWDIIRKVHDGVEIPVIGNGDIFLPGHAKYVLERNMCDAVMLARGAKGNPYIFKRVTALLKTGKNIPEPTILEQMRIIFELVETYTDVQKRQTFNEVRDHVMWMVAGTPFASKLRHDLLKAADLNTLIKVVRQYYSHAKYSKPEDEYQLTARLARNETSSG
ncbi:tRNA dihydrouridine synthase DusB [Candidatus Woesearchaeota archaeon]|nr:tRNA dihydrouridine synthase DusB [Candidatus Woesearchaeota archaeon]